MFTPGRVAPLAEDAPFQWISHLRSPAGDIEAAEKDTDEFLAALLCSPGLPTLEVPEELRYDEATIQPRPSLRIRAADPSVHVARKLRVELSFDYEGHVVSADEPTRGFYDAAARRVVRRDSAADKAAAGLLGGRWRSRQDLPNFCPWP